eukprot:GDKK01033499.1.p1 GENE.GDKK01033499.1~~GDKK01033499.1.p1  ORF type:complete len:100 (+),score=2.73 GDKK01033499.1:23-301(+)
MIDFLSIHSTNKHLPSEVSFQELKQLRVVWGVKFVQDGATFGTHCLIFAAVLGLHVDAVVRGQVQVVEHAVHGALDVALGALDLAQTVHANL